MEELIVVYTDAFTRDLYTAAFDGLRWKEATAIKSQNGSINANSRTAPGTAVLNNWLYIVYKPVDSTDLNCAWFDGTKWNGGIPIKSMNGGIALQSNSSPKIAEFHGVLYMVYLPPNSNSLHCAWFDGVKWAGGTPIRTAENHDFVLQSSDNPGICSYKGNLYIVFFVVTAFELCLAWFNGVTWLRAAMISSMPGNIRPNPHGTTPGMTEYGGLLYLVYNGPRSKFYTCIFDGNKWRGNTEIGSQPGGIDPVSDFGPGLSAFKDQLCLAYSSPSSTSPSAGNLYACYFNGTAWHGNTKIDTPGGVSIAAKTPIQVSAAGTIPEDQSNWLTRLRDDILIGDINLPGSHDAAAINRSMTTPYACQNLSITRQLQCGIRILDVRLQASLDKNLFTFMTCHGTIGSTVGANVYQSFTSLMDECRQFLVANGGETIVMILTIEDWSNITERTVKDQAIAALEHLVARYPITSPRSMPTLGALRGKILLYNRIHNHPDLGVPIDWDDNTEGSYAKNALARQYRIYVQDKFQGFSTFNSRTEKLNLVTAAFGRQRSGESVLNFASATWVGMGLYIMPDLLNFFGQNAAAQRPSKFGWIMFDYGLDNFDTDIYSKLNIVTMIIASNFGYRGYEKKFKVIEHDL
jgi:hypothetical protein